mmetsp:Transcript_9208/g.23073  ORF Transcript_9208/g.23073 Transcript_9208/m.23073 type:complete len:516 (-) Transcript_9208:499-2046(-)
MRVLHNAAHCLHLVQVAVGRLAGEQLNDRAAEAPDVGCLHVPFAKKNLGRHPERRARGAAHVVLCVQLAADAKVAELAHAVFVQQNICGLHIAVDYFMVVEVKQPFQDLLCVNAAQRLRDGAKLVHQLRQRAALQVLHGNVHAVVVRDGVHVLDHVGVVQRAEDGNLFRDKIQVFLVGADGDLLDGKQLPCGRVQTAPHRAERSLAQQARQLKLPRGIRQRCAQRLLGDDFIPRDRVILVCRGRVVWDVEVIQADAVLLVKGTWEVHLLCKKDLRKQRGVPLARPRGCRLFRLLRRPDGVVHDRLGLLARAALRQGLAPCGGRACSGSRLRRHFELVALAQLGKGEPLARPARLVVRARGGRVRGRVHDLLLPGRRALRVPLAAGPRGDVGGGQVHGAWEVLNKLHIEDFGLWVLHLLYGTTGGGRRGIEWLLLLLLTLLLRNGLHLGFQVGRAAARRQRLLARRYGGLPPRQRHRAEVHLCGVQHARLAGAALFNLAGELGQGDVAQGAVLAGG